MGKSKQSKISVLDRGNDFSIAQSLQRKTQRSERVEDKEKTQEDCVNETSINETSLKKEIEIGLDISTAVVGIVGLTKEGQFEFMEHVKFSAKQDSLWLKADEIEKRLLELEKKYQVKRVFVEASAKGFSPGFSSADTLFTLAKFNGIVSYIARRVFSGTTIHDINVNSARKAAGIKVNRSDKTRSTKEQVFDAVRAAYPNFPWLTHTAKNGKHKGKVVFDKENYDRCDAWVICRGGQLTTPSN